MEVLGPGGHHLFLCRQVELSPGGEGAGGGLQQDSETTEKRQA